MVRKLTDGNQIESGLSVVAFSAQWCPPCRVMDPIYEEAAGRFPGLSFYKADQEVAADLFILHQVHSIPTYLVMKDGKEVHRQVGAIAAPRFTQMIQKFL